jgi:hypothetical protein
MYLSEMPVQAHAKVELDRTREALEVLPYLHGHRRKTRVNRAGKV